MPARIGNITFDCRDALRLATFWAAALGRQLDDGGDAGFASLTSVPVAALCAQSSLYRGGSAGIVEQAQCGAWTVVVEARGPPCLSFWLFNDAGSIVFP